MPFQALTSDVREEAGNVLAVDFPDPEIVKEQAAAFDFLTSKIGFYDATHEKIAAIKKLEIILAASFVLNHFNKDKAKEKYDQFTSLLTILEGSLTGGAGDLEYKHTVTTYGSYVAAHQEDPDTEVRYYKSTKTLMLESQSRLIVQSSIPALQSNDPAWIITNCRDMF
jgi:hypothetical protein